MKKISRLIIPLTLLICFVGCKKGFEKLNQNPYGITKIDPGLLFTGAELGMNAGNWDGEQTIAQQYLNAYNSGATAGFNFNDDIDGYNSPRWGIYTATVKPLVQIISLTQNDPSAKNLYNMTRIWKAYAFMTLVDTYGDVPYSDAGKAYLSGLLYPKYDKMAAIYADLYNELKTATGALSVSNEYVTGDLFFGGATASSPALIAAQVAQWKKIGYSLLLRLGIRYSKTDVAKAQSIAQEAYAGGVMQSNADNVVIKGYSVANPNNFSNLQRSVSPYFYYLAEPFVNQLKNTKDPRLKYMGASYIKPQDFTSTRDTTTANQFGFPVGYDQSSVLTAPGYRGIKGGGQNYTQLNYDVVANVLTPQFFITYSQTQLLLAEAQFRGWIVGTLSTQQYYESGIIASMDEWKLYPNVPNPAISVAEENWYVAQPAVLFNNANALQLINTQYWISSFVNGPESWANVRRSGFPVLAPNMYNNNLNGGFVRRMAYPDAEQSQNAVNNNAAVASMGGDGLTQKIFWDIP
ncbi:SusD/RagB family nutrient-binding outer membrane lipoprotein [Mucilaginibacter sp.]|uniref:SusD/RagB family nutrient-binding outer membrane lipoprotein n=1 Tax=Mucilaginibacter sp. TaxID=1882438 RepID=UPI0025F46CB3|nr:SusD/RagB family nutrient-binding outer membrane lipoprotein [Mucilaginibacter sp.]